MVGIAFSGLGSVEDPILGNPLHSVCNVEKSTDLVNIWSPVDRNLPYIFLNLPIVTCFAGIGSFFIDLGALSLSLFLPYVT
jgi:hypothetical protein